MTRQGSAHEGRNGPVKFLRGIGEPERVGEAQAITRFTGKPIHPCVEVWLIGTTEIRARFLLHQDAFGPDGPLPSLKDPNRYITMSMSKEWYEALPDCTYTLQGDWVYRIRLVDKTQAKTLQEVQDERN